MSKIIIYDNKNFLLAELKGKVEKELTNEDLSSIAVLQQYEYTARFDNFRLIHSFSLKKQLKKIEKILKYHKERKK